MRELPFSINANEYQRCFTVFSNWLRIAVRCCTPIDDTYAEDRMAENEAGGVMVTLRMADGSRKMNIEVFSDETVREFLGEAKKEWALDASVSYKLLNVRTSQYLPETDSFTSKIVTEGDVLELQPDVDAG